MITMWLDALLCFAIPRLTRWTAVVVDRFDATEYPIVSVRFRWRRSADTWTLRAGAMLIERGGRSLGCDIRSRRLEPP